MGLNLRHNFAHKIKLCFEWPKIFKCLQNLLLLPCFLVYLIYSILTMNNWFLSSRFTDFPEFIFPDIFQWLHFMSCLLVCFVSKVFFSIISWDLFGHTKYSLAFLLIQTRYSIQNNVHNAHIIGI